MSKNEGVDQNGTLARLSSLNIYYNKARGAPAKLALGT